MPTGTATLAANQAAGPPAGSATSQESATSATLVGLAATIALEIARRGGRVELVGSIGDDAAGDEVVVELGRAGIGHAALLRDPGGTTPVAGHLTSQLPRLDAADVELGLRYVAEYHVLILADPLSPDAEAAAIEAAAYHDAPLVAILPEGGGISPALSAAATVLEAPTTEGDDLPYDPDLSYDSNLAYDPDDPSGPSAPHAQTSAPLTSQPFAAFVAALAIRIDAGSSGPEAFAEAVKSTGWEQATSA
jgi:hypothetical protein